MVDTNVLPMVAVEQVEVTGETLWAFRASWSTAVRKFEDGDALDYRARRALAGLGGFACEEQVPNEYDASGSLSFSLDTLRRHAGQGACGYWTAFSNAIEPHPLVPAASNPDYDPAFDNSSLHEYLTTILGSRGETSLFVLEAVASGPERGPCVRAKRPLRRQRPTLRHRRLLALRVHGSPGHPALQLHPRLGLSARDPPGPRPGLNLVRLVGHQRHRAEHRETSTHSRSGSSTDPTSTATASTFASISRPKRAPDA